VQNKQELKEEEVRAKFVLQTEEKLMIKFRLGEHPPMILTLTYVILNDLQQILAVAFR